ncbi:hypothetical protein [Nocardioides sambongensis]|uniref:hypothetical protein n=1 Tax=Nocardioides sambongensis TaxID=2589074 RepID=UPI00112BB63B|nr:hypothetical protein [Nocardioides sambongensis]
MRSERSAGDEQGMLPFELEVPEAARPRRAARAAPQDVVPVPLRHRMATDALASRGWPEGTELLVARGRRPRRGDVALVIDGGRRRVGVYGLELGRVALRSDHGSVWLGPSAEVLGVVVQVAAPLPEPPPSGRG